MHEPTRESTLESTESGELKQENTSFGTFKPVGKVLLGIDPGVERSPVVGALRAVGIEAEAISAFAPSETREEMQAMIEDASGLAGFGFEITLMRRLLKMSTEGYRWLLVRVDDLETAQGVAAAAKSAGVSLAWYYRLMTVEEL